MASQYAHMHKFSFTQSSEFQKISGFAFHKSDAPYPFFVTHPPLLVKPTDANWLGIFFLMLCSALRTAQYAEIILKKNSYFHAPAF